MADEKKYDDIDPVSEGSVNTTTKAKVMPLYADERGYHEKDEGYDDNIVVRSLGMLRTHKHPLLEETDLQMIDPNSKDGAIQRNLKSRHVAMVRHRNFDLDLPAANEDSCTDCYWRYYRYWSFRW